MQKILAIIIALFVGLFQPKPLDIPSPDMPSPPRPVNLIFAGDLSFDRHIRQMADQNSYDFILVPLKDLFFSADLVIVNLETPITDNPSVSVGSVIGSPQNYRFTSAPETAAVLARHNIKLVNLGNNHTLNFGLDGLKQTKGYLTAAGVDFFGNTGQASDSARSAVKQINQLNFGFVNYNQFASDSLSAALEDLQTLRPRVDVLIVFCHWGEEYQPIASPTIQAMAHQFIDNGADLVIGTHPHVIQQSEIYQGQPIYYSLGNFVYDQYFSPQTRKGMLVSVTTDPENLISTSTQEDYVDLLPSGQTILSATQ
ncbi:MAG: CapA family protein [Candidatus Beckwithbacteria bacterium]|nr:CapA family protein [Candidatus Beckwithbacteria bacterium]